MDPPAYHTSPSLTHRARQLNITVQTSRCQGMSGNASNAVHQDYRTGCWRSAWKSKLRTPRGGGEEKQQANPRSVQCQGWPMRVCGVAKLGGGHVSQGSEGGAGAHAQRPLPSQAGLMLEALYSRGGSARTAHAGRDLRRPVSRHLKDKTLGGALAVRADLPLHCRCGKGGTVNEGLMGSRRYFGGAGARHLPDDKTLTSATMALQPRAQAGEGSLRSVIAARGRDAAPHHPWPANAPHLRARCS